MLNPGFHTVYVPETCLGHFPDSAWSIQLDCVWDMSKAHLVLMEFSLCTCMVIVYQHLPPVASHHIPYLGHCKSMPGTNINSCCQTYFSGVVVGVQ